jgi:hypothetical protein
MATCRPTLFLLTVKEILLVHFIITNFRVAHKMLCTSWLRNPLTTSRLSCLDRKPALTTIFLSVRQSRISQPCYTNNYSRYIIVVYLTSSCVNLGFLARVDQFKTRVKRTSVLKVHECQKTQIYTRTS